jgi:3-dehydroquinate synthase
MRRVIVRTPGGDYPVLIGTGVVAEIPRLLGRKPVPSSLYVVTDSRVRSLHGKRLDRCLRGPRLPVARTVLPPGEGSKNLRSMERIWRAIIRSGADRRVCLVAHGGGVVGDMAGFAAATILRGAQFIQVPTTLLAMVDASVGGKTGVNVPEGKNLVGAFHQPRAVVMDIDALATLSRRQQRNGWAEVLKTAAIRDARFLGRLDREREALLQRDPGALASVVARCVKIKAAVVEADERESGLRMILNFGHTLAHGIEAAQGYRGLLHGEAVAVGMVFAARLGERLGRTAPGTAARLERLISGYGLPVGLRDGDSSRILKSMALDKKRGPKGLRWVLLTRVGQAEVVDDVPLSLVARELRRFLE